MCKEEHRHIIALIGAIRDSHPDMLKLYMEGQCFNFAQILRTQFPGGEFWYSHVEGHMYYFYKGKWYDIRGVHLMEPMGSSRYSFLDGDPAHRWGRRDKRRLI